MTWKCWGCDTINPDSATEFCEVCDEPRLREESKERPRTRLPRNGKERPGSPVPVTIPRISVTQIVAGGGLLLCMTIVVSAAWGSFGQSTAAPVGVTDPAPPAPTPLPPPPRRPEQNRHSSVVAEPVTPQTQGSTGSDPVGQGATAAAAAAGDAERERQLQVDREAALEQDRLNAEQQAAIEAEKERLALESQQQRDAAAQAQINAMAAQLRAANEAKLQAESEVERLRLQRVAEAAAAVAVRERQVREKQAADQAAAAKAREDRLSAERAVADEARARASHAQLLQAQAAAQFLASVAGRWELREENGDNERRTVTESDLTIGNDCSGILTRKVKSQSKGFRGWSDDREETQEYGFRCAPTGQVTGQLSGRVTSLSRNNLEFLGKLYRRR